MVTYAAVPYSINYIIKVSFIWNKINFVHQHNISQTDLSIVHVAMILHIAMVTY